MIDIDNLNLSKIEPLWLLMTKGEKLGYKDSEKGERNSSDIKTWGEPQHRGTNMKVRGSTKI